MSRAVHARYLDPLDHIWLATAARLGLRVQRREWAYASTDGRGTLTIAPESALDEDDCLAQIIFHEICHYLVQGEGSFHQPDWGLVNDEREASYPGGTAREEACLRVQAALARKYGLRGLLAPTTDFRAFYDALPPDPLEASAGDPALPLARAALGRAARSPLCGALHDALGRTALIHEALRGCALGPLARETSSEGAPVPVLAEQAAPPPRHPVGFPLHEDPARRCADCAFRVGARCGRADEGSQLLGGARTHRLAAEQPACVLHEAGPLDCQACAACCRHAYDTVLLSAREPLRRSHPELIERDGGVLRLRRSPDGARCAALGGAEEGPYACAVYEERPRTCRDFTRGSAHCLSARRRVGLSV